MNPTAFGLDIMAVESILVENCGYGTSDIVLMASYDLLRVPKRLLFFFKSLE